MATQSELVDRLFVRLSEMYGSKFAAAWDGQNLDGVKRTWADGLMGLSPQQVGEGIKRCLSREWPPSLPEFRSLCLPDFETLYLVGQHNPRSSALAYWAVQSFGYYEIRRSSWKTAGDRWTRICEQLIRDGVPELPPEPQKIEHKAAPADPALAHEAINRMRDMRGEIRDPLRWARKIMERVEAGEKMGSPVFEQFAREALGLPAAGA